MCVYVRVNVTFCRADVLLLLEVSLTISSNCDLFPKEWPVCRIRQITLVLSLSSGFMLFVTINRPSKCPYTGVHAGLWALSDF